MHGITRGAPAASEERLLAATSRARMEEDLGWFAANGLRLGGTEAERAAAAHIEQAMACQGIECSLLEFPSFVGYGETPERFGPARVQLDGRQFDGKTYAFGASTPRDGLTAELVWVGSGSPADYERLGADVAGRIALSELSFEAPHGEPARVAQEHGALGVIVMNWSDEHPDFVHTGTARGVWGNPTPEDLEHLPALPMVAISRRDGLRLKAVAGSAATVTLSVQTDRRWVTAQQPVATIRGSSPRFILVYCHLDAFGAGMTDNATGAVGLMELARVLHAHRESLGYSVRIAWFACHEMPYNGSTWYLDSHWDELRDGCVAVVNADSWAIGDSEGELALWTFPELGELMSRSVTDVVGAPCEVTDFDAKEAEQSFWALGTPSTMLFSVNPRYSEREGMEYLGPWFHTEHDTLDRVGRTALEELVKVYALAVARLSVQPRTPLRVDDLATRLHALVNDLAERAPSELRLTPVVAQAGELVDVARLVEQIAHEVDRDRLDRVLLRVAQVLNPVIYTIAGHYGQDPSSATYLRKRLPGLQLVIDECAHDADRQAWLTRGVRERNRLADALLEAGALLGELCR